MTEKYCNMILHNFFEYSAKKKNKHDIEFHMCFNQGEQGGEGEQGPPGEPGSMVM